MSASSMLLPMVPEAATGIYEILNTDREQRQEMIISWVDDTFSDDDPDNLTIEVRALRFLEEAIELYQAAGGDLRMVNKLGKYIFARPPGEMFQEIGGVSTTLLALAGVSGISADKAEAAEISRVLSKPKSLFAARNAIKNAAGFVKTKPKIKRTGWLKRALLTIGILSHPNEPYKGS